jgi:ABC-2 type transport system ATP-binding protein
VSAPAVEVCDLVVRYGTKTAVDGLSLTVEAGSITTLLGPNGAGKTTTMEACEGYRRPSSGTVRVLDLDPIGQHRLLAPRVGVMLQSGGAWSGVRAQEMLRYVASLHANPLPVDTLVERLGLASCGHTPYRRLSGGQQQRLSLALALVGRPDLVVLDEPTAGLDPQGRHDTWDLVTQLAADGVTVLLTTHYLEEAERLATFVYVIDAGRVVTAGTPAALTATENPRTIRFTAPPGLDTSALATGLPPGSTVHESPAGSYRVDGNVTPASLATVTSWCAAQNVMPHGLAVEEHTLEDVFLELTGRELRS